MSIYPGSEQNVFISTCFLFMSFFPVLFFLFFTVSLWLCPCVYVIFNFLHLIITFSLFFMWREQFLFSYDASEELKEAISKKNHELVYLYDINLVDEIWKETRPRPPNKPIRVHDLKYAGVDVSSKLSSLRSELTDAGSSAIVISMLDEIAWLLNLVALYPISWR